MKTHIGWARAAQGTLLAGLAGASIWGCSAGAPTTTGGPTQNANAAGSSGAAADNSGSSSSSSGNGNGPIGNASGSIGGSNGSSSSSGSATPTGGSSSGSAPAGSSGSSGSGGAGSGVGGSSGDAGGSAAGSSSGAAGSGGAGSGGAGQSPSTTVGFASDRVIVTGVHNTATPPATSSINLHNGGATAVTVSALALSGTNAAVFQLNPAPTLPAMIAPGMDLAVTVELLTTSASLPAEPSDKNLGSALAQATLTATLSTGTSTASVFGLALIQDNYEPTLGQILTTLGYVLNVGQAQNNWNPNTSMNPTTLPGIETGTDEVAAPYFTKAGTGM